MIHSIPVPLFGWICTVVSVGVLCYIGLRGLARRTRRRGDRAPRRLATALILAILGLAALTWIDFGHSFIRNGHVTVTVRSEFVQTVSSGPSGFSMFSYRAANLAMASDSHVLALVPENESTQNWIDLRSSRSVRLALVGIPAALSPDESRAAGLSTGLRSAIDHLAAAISRLPTGHLYITGSAGSSSQIKAGDTLLLAHSGIRTYWTVNGRLTNLLLRARPRAIVPLSVSQRLNGTANTVNRLLLLTVYNSASDPSANAGVVSGLRQLRSPTLSAGRLLSQVRTASRSGVDWTRRLALVALLLVVGASFCLWALGVSGSGVDSVSSSSPRSSSQPHIR